MTTDLSILNHLKDENKFVAYLDVLGFKEMVKAKAHQLISYLETISNVLKDIGSPEIESQLISDSTILACPATIDSLRLLLTTIQSIQFSCSYHNIWIRGAVSVGDIYFDRERHIVVGNGLTNAYLLESQAKFPRVIIDPRVIKKISGSKEKFVKEFNFGDSENHILGNLIPLIHQYPNNYHSTIRLIDDDAVFVAFAERIALDDDVHFLDKAFQNIESELYNSMVTYEKYLWLKKYFTEVIVNLLTWRVTSSSKDKRHENLNYWHQRFRGL